MTVSESELLALFVSPPADALLSCIEACQGPGNPPRYAPIKAGDYRRAMLEQYHRTGRPGISQPTGSRLREGAEPGGRPRG